MDPSNMGREGKERERDDKVDSILSVEVCGLFNLEFIIRRNRIIGQHYLLASDQSVGLFKLPAAPLGCRQ